MGKIIIKLPNKRLKPFKKHLEKEHPSTKGNIKIKLIKVKKKK